MLNSDFPSDLKDWWKPTQIGKVTKVRYDIISKKVCGLLKELNICSYPVDLDNVIYSLNKLGINLELESYSEYAKFKNTTISYLEREVFKSEDGATAYIPEADLYIIFINDTIPSKRRIYWTKAHEIGHIVLNHYSIMKPILLRQRGLADKQYNLLEQEANWFAKLLICNPHVLKMSGLNTIEDIMEVCNISFEAAEYRVNDISKSLIYNNFDMQIIMQFSDFCNQKTCVRCQNRFFIPNAEHCPVCGHAKFRKAREQMIYSSIELDENSKVIVCHKCENENILNGDYCQICGIILVNRCRVDDNSYYNNSCGELAEGDARYCCKCGNETTFGYLGLLKNWEDEKNTGKKMPPSAFASIPTFEEISEDEDIPF